MPTPRDHAMLVRAATLYYLDGKSQSEVATAIGVSRSNVSRVLANARANGIVDIRINDPLGRATELEQSLMAKYRLRGCRVAPSGPTETALTRVGSLGAHWLKEHLPAKGVIALSWGSAVHAVVDEYERDPMHESLEVLPLVGGLSSVDSAGDGNVLVRSLAMKLGAQHRALHAPAVVESAATQRAFLGEPSISNVLNDAASASIAIVGIGNVGVGASSAIIDSMKLDDVERQEFIESGAVGDCCTRYFDADGHPVHTGANDRVIAIDLERLKKIPTVVGVAAGDAKVEGAHGALLGRLFDVLIVDSELAHALLARA